MDVSTFVAILIVVPLCLYLGYWIVSFLRNPYRSFGRNDKTTAAMGSVLQDIDRLLARPSVEHKIEVERKVHKRDDDIGGE